MKRYYLLLALILSTIYGAYAQAPNAATLSKVVFPKLSTDGGQQTKGLFYIQLNNTNRNIVLTSNSSSIIEPSWTIQNSENLGQLWWVVQDYSKNAFLFVSALSGKAVKFGDYYATMGDLSLSNATSDYYYNFVKPIYNTINIKGITKTYGIRMANSNLLNNDYKVWTVIDWGALYNTELWKLYSVSANRLKEENSDPARATFGLVPVGKIGQDPFIPVPFQNSKYHKIFPDFIEPGTNAIVTQVMGTEPSTDRKRIAISNLATINNIANDSLLRVRFWGFDANVGWISAEKTSYSLNTVQNGDGKRIFPRYGVGTLNNKLYIIKDGITDALPANFISSEPVFIGIRDGALTVTQTVGTITSRKAYYDVALGSILNKSAGAKAAILVDVKKGFVSVSYKPGSWFFSGTDVGTEEPFITSTNPDFALLPVGKGTITNKFDWRTSEYTLRYKSAGVVIEEKALSPFFYNLPGYTGISAQHKLDGTIKGGQDNDPYSGWEMIKNDFGYTNDGAQIADARLRNEPYMILYNRVLGTLRVFVYIHNSSIANSYKVTLAVENSPMNPLSKYKPPYLWDSYLRGMALDDEDISGKEYYKAKSLSSSSSGKYYYTDFVMDYDPCVAFFESSIRVSVDKVTNGTLQIVGRSLGGVLPGQTGITDWMQKNDNFMQGALNQPYGSLAQTMGDMTFNNYKAWGLTDLQNYANFVIPGKKIAPWEREAAKLSFQGITLQASGGFIQSSSTLIKAAGEAFSTVQIFGVDAGGPVKAAGALVEASGQFLESSGTAMLAESARLLWTKSSDELDKNIQVEMPAPQPSLVFSDLAMQGTLSIQTPVFNDILITTPGSKNAEGAPEYNVNGSKGAFPLYNEPLGLINLLNKPKFCLSLVRAHDIANYDCSMAIKEHPVFVANIAAGVSQVIPSVQIAVTTYDINGVATKSRSTKAYLQTNLTSDVPQDMVMPYRFKLNDLIDAETLEKNYLAAGGDALTNEQLSLKLASWIKLDLQMSLITSGPKLPNGVYGGASLTIAYKANTIYTGGRSASNSINDFSYENLDPNYNLSNNQVFGAKHVFNRLDPVFASLMETYCNAHQTGSIVKNKVGTTLKTATATATETAIAPALSILPIYKEGLSIFPNPALDLCNLSYTAKAAGNVHISLIDMVGKNIIGHDDLAKDKGEQKTAQIHLTGLAAGVYLIKITFADGTGYVEKVIKK